MGKVTNLFGCLVLRDGELVHDDLWIRNGKIIDPETVGHDADLFIDCLGCIASPGFIDLKLNGAFGVDFQDHADDVEKAVDAVAAQLPSTGVTMFCPTLITTSPQVYKKVLPKVEIRQPDAHRGAGVIGLHLDGPFITVEGAHPPEYVRRQNLNMEELQKVYGTDLEKVAIVTLAPEIPGALEIIPELVRWGINVSLGHSKADLEVGEKAVANGASMISHLFNAMPNLHHRDPSLVGLVASRNVKRPLRFGLISDGHHIHPAALRMAYRMSPETLMLVSDGQAPLGKTEGEYTVHGRQVEVTEQKGGGPICTLKGTSTLFGSVCPLNVAVRKFVELADCPLGYALEAVTKRPAEAVGLYPKKGSLLPQADADFTLIDPTTFKILATFIDGHKVYDAGEIRDLDQILLHSLTPEGEVPMGGSSGCSRVKRRKSVQS